MFSGAQHLCAQCDVCVSSAPVVCARRHPVGFVYRDVAAAAALGDEHVPQELGSDLPARPRELSPAHQQARLSQGRRAEAGGQLLLHGRLEVAGHLKVCNTRPDALERAAGSHAQRVGAQLEVRIFLRDSRSMLRRITKLAAL
eukprot:3999426-Pleurochrysis_carterae.AAC.2